MTAQERGSVMAEAVSRSAFSVVGGTLYVDGCQVEVFRDNLVLDLRIQKLDPSKIESLNVFLEDVQIASLAAVVGSP